MKTKTVLHEGYEAPQCKVYRITVESVIAGSPNEYTQGGGGTYDDDTTNDNGDY